MIKYSLFGIWSLLKLLKSINTGNILKAVMTEENFAKSERYKINRKHSHPKN